jgi:hypothetical protein
MKLDGNTISLGIITRNKEHLLYCYNIPLRNGSPKKKCATCQTQLVFLHQNVDELDTTATHAVAGEDATWRQSRGMFGLCPQAALPKLASQFFGAGFGRP